MPAIHIVVFAHLVWLGLYLRNRAGDSRAGNYTSAGLLISGYAAAQYVFSNADEPNAAFAAVLVLPAVGFLAGGLHELFRSSEQSERARSWPVGVGVVSGSVAFALVALMDLSLDSGVVDFAVPFAGAAFVFCGLFVGRRLAKERGEAFLPDVFRSYDYSFLIASLFGGQVVLAMWTGPGATGPMVFLLIGTITAAITIQVYLDRVQSLLDRIAFANVPWLRQERAELRQIENLLPRVNMTDPLTIEEEEFSRLTRRALSNYGDLTKLATSPLTNLPEVHRRLAARQVEPSTLELIEDSAASVTGAIAVLDDESLDKRAVLPAFGPDPLAVRDWIEMVVIGHIGMHQPSIEAATGK